MTCRLCGGPTGTLKTCRACREKRNVLNARWREQNREKANRASREEKLRCIERGVCVCCRDPDRTLVSDRACEQCLREKALADTRRSPRRMTKRCGRCRGVGHQQNSRLCPARYAVDFLEYATRREAA